MGFEQSGILKAVLYENISVILTKNISGGVDYIINSGKVIEITGQDHYTINFEDDNYISQNRKVIHDYRLFFNVYGFNNLSLLNDLASVYGFLPVLFFANGDIKFINSPLFLERQIDYNEANTQVYNVILTNQSPTFNNYIDFENTIITWILADGTWNDSGIWIDSETWNDN
jgi:hypothetical protein